MSETIQDLRYAARLYRRSPGFTLTATILLALGIAVNTAIFSIIDAIFLRPLPVSHPNELVRFVYQTPGAPPFGDHWYSIYTFLRDRKELFADVIGQHESNIFMRDGAVSDRVRAHFVTGNFFSMLGVRALRGRALTPEDELAGGALPVVLSDAFWKRRFAADPGVVGRTIWLQGQNALIVGVTAPEFNGISVETTPDMRVPFGALAVIYPGLSRQQLEDRFDLELIGRLRPGLTEARAQQQFPRVVSDYLHSDISLDQKNFYSALKIDVQSVEYGMSRFRDQFGNALLFLMCAAGLLLLIVCANLAGLLLVRCALRQPEIAVRAAVGASTGRLVRQLLTENALLAFAGGAAGLILALIAMPAISRLLPPIRHLDATSLPLTLRIEPDLRMFSFSLLICLVTILLFGLGPAFQSVRRDFHSSLKSARSRGHSTGRNFVVVAQVALCTFLLVAAGLLLATFDRLRRLDPGFDAGKAATFSLDPGMKRLSTDEAKSLANRLMERVQTLPGVERVALASRGVMRGTGLKIRPQFPGRTPDPKEGLAASLNIVSPGYFATMGMSFVSGRDFKDTEPSNQPSPLIVNQAFAKRFFPGLDPIGQLVGVGARGRQKIVGVVGDSKYRSLREPISPILYTLLMLGNGARVEPFILHVRTRVKPESMIGPVQNILRAIDPELAFYEIKTLAEEVHSSLWAERVVAELAVVFSVWAVLLAAIGIYGLLSYTVTQRTREIGIRMALGANPRNIVNLISRQMLGMIAAGIAVGVAGSLAAASVIRHLLYEIPADDPFILSVAVAFIGCIALSAAAIPALRAARGEPATALRTEN